MRSAGSFMSPVVNSEGSVPPSNQYDSGAPAAVGSAAPAAAAGGWWATKVDAIEVSDDEEPWFKGAAEMYALVTGFGLDGKVRVDPVDMPYLDHDGTVYRPHQILVNWSSYKYDLADVVLMEEDGSTNYQALAKAIAAVLRGFRTP